MLQPRVIVGIGDLHGHIPALEGILELVDSSCGIRDADGKIRPDVQLVFCGDYIDRGTQSLELLNRIIGLQTENPNVTALNGNHELIALAGLDGARQILASGTSFVRDSYERRTVHGYNGGTALLDNFTELAAGDSRAGMETMVAELSRDGNAGKWLRERPAGVIHAIEGKNILFIHGGVPIYLKTREELERTLQDYAAHMGKDTGEAGGSEQKFLRDSLVDEGSLFWVRDMPKRPREVVQEQLRGLGIDYTVFGHTPREQITTYHDVLFDIDVGMSEVYGARGPAAIVFKKEGIFAVDKRQPQPSKLREL